MRQTAVWWVVALGLMAPASAAAQVEEAPAGGVVSAEGAGDAAPSGGDDAETSDEEPVAQEPVEDATQGAEEPGGDAGQGAQEPPPETGQAVPDEEARQAARKAEVARAKALVAEARKLMKIQRHAEAIPKLQDAYLILEDPELLRMLGDAYAATGEREQAVGAYDAYLAEPTVGEMSKEPVRQQRAALVKPAAGDKEGEDDEGWGFTGWVSSGAAPGGVPGHLYLMFGPRFTYNPGGEFKVARGGTGPDADEVLPGQWVHGGAGGQAEVGAYITERLSLGLMLGLDGMQWDNRGFTTEFTKTTTSGLRPDVGLNLRYYAGWGFHFGLTLGGDMMVVTDVPSQVCDAGLDCPEVEIGDGPQGYRLFYGLLGGYRTVLAGDFLVGLESSFRMLPIFETFSDATVATLPGYTDSSWMLNVALVFSWNR